MDFRKFIIAEEMDPQPGPSKKADYFDGLGDEMGMTWGEIVKTLEGSPQVAAHFALGTPGQEVLYKRSAWKIVPGTLTHNGADIVLVPQERDRSYLGGNRLNKSAPDRRRYHLNREQLAKFLTTGWNGGGAVPLPGV